MATNNLCSQCDARKERDEAIDMARDYRNQRDVALAEARKLRWERLGFRVDRPALVEAQAEIKRLKERLEVEGKLVEAMAAYIKPMYGCDTPEREEILFVTWCKKCNQFTQHRYLPNGELECIWSV